ncbi:DNA-binding SARP family transcriptional activator [Streptomyces sp. SLBN-118]|uniref:BTAD domain-containing putative transcriptional regulator n=1 Tax=Streptomyces sp. SLBN-118 TaxID=2768454 RepID=UPI00115297E7|nr:BTAD domain-containing putative transcriptional regulator [Streptomyces sp. SLBN-118]TQK44219.1 DNA-binding SARP family transcriptional activator [Streptomyces sp. SLBN-118]
MGGWLRIARGDGLRAARIKAGLTQDEVARRAEISVRTVRHIERGQVKNPRHETLARMAEVVGYDYGAAAPGSEPDADQQPDQPGFHYEIRLLGPLTVLCTGLPVAMPLKQRALLGLLAVQPDQTVSHEEIADVLWSGEAPPAYQKLVHTYVARLRRLIEPGQGRHARGARRISTVRGGYVFNSRGVELDLRQFEERSAQAKQTAAADPMAALELFGQALRGWQGRLLQDLSQLWQHPAVVRVAQRHIDVAIEFADLAIRLNRSAFAVEHLRVASYEEPLHEALQARIMLALAGSGRRAAALRLFADLRIRLKKELGVEPSEEIWQARNAILTHYGPDGPSGPDGPNGPERHAGHTAAQPPGSATTQAYGTARGSWPAPQEPRTASSSDSRPRSLAPPAQLPPVITPFIGRQEQLEVLDGLLAHQRKGHPSVGIAAIHGPPEIGKTALAVRWAHHRHEEFPDGQLYADLRGSAEATGRPVDPRTVLTRFLRSLGVPDAWIPDTREESSALFRSLLAGRHFLVLLDDAADAAQVRALLPGTPGNLVVVTSRSPLIDLVTREGAQSIPLDVLSAAESYALIETHLGPERTQAEPEATAELAAVCGQYPLELRMAVARLAATPHLSIHALVAELARRAADHSYALRSKQSVTSSRSRNAGNGQWRRLT